MEDPFHLLDLCRLTRDDRTAQVFDLRIANGGFLTHEDGACMVWNHGAEELLITDGGLLSDQEEEP